MQKLLLCLLPFLLPTLTAARAQGTVPTWEYQHAGGSYTLAGHNPTAGQTTIVPVLLVPVRLHLEAKTTGGSAVMMDASQDVPSVLRSPVFSAFPFLSGGKTQYIDAMLRATFPDVSNWHTLLGKPKVQPVEITVPLGRGYALSSRKGGGALAVVDVDYLQKQIFGKLPRQDGTLVVVLTHNTAYYVDGDATICCTWGTHGIARETGNSFVLGSYLKEAPAVIKDSDVQPLTEQLAEFFYDPRHDPQHYGYNVTTPGNAVPSWTFARADLGCGGTGIGSSYFLLQPTDTNPKNNFPASPAFTAGTYHLENIALLPWYLQPSIELSQNYSFPDPNTLSKPATRCVRTGMTVASGSSAGAAPSSADHRLIGYWTGHGPGSTPFPLRRVAPAWDIVIVAFDAPVKNATEGTLNFRLPNGITAEQFKGDVRYLKSRGKKVMISLGGGGEYFQLDDPTHVANFVSSVTQIVTEYGFDGVDIDFESPSLVLQPGDTDFHHPTTPSVVNLIAGLRQLHDHFGPGFMLSLVPEGPQLPAGFVTYGGQFGSYLPITDALRDILSFVDVQDYNTPPLEGLDGEIYQSHTADYHAAMTELLLHGFPVGGDPKRFFPPLPQEKVAVGFLEDYDQPALARKAMATLLTGKALAGSNYKLREPAGYPHLMGAMLWTIDDDQLNGYDFSNLLGPLLHGNVYKIPPITAVDLLLINNK